jgi:hypothetical protein
VLHKSGQVKLANGGLILSLSQFLLLPQLLQNLILDTKMVKNIISLD